MIKEMIEELKNVIAAFSFVGCILGAALIVSSWFYGPWWMKVFTP